ncbi:unnamed protein product [Chrysodeixis includens]|uniref:C2H2-type domain-containing protein n=1 Tax=Chrysodeixis includens TaxID=689277 RepID=A0A9P0C3D5_CHRIL|nr:unnamed protein product [Chrysodeixis includens]
MSPSDGVKEEPKCSNSELLEESVIDSSFQEWKDIPPEKAFLGFEKVPLVRIARYDITPYLKTSSVAVGSCRIKGTETLDKHFPKLTSLCSVKLAKQDIDILEKGILSKKVRRSTSSSSSDGEKAAMTSVKCKTCGKSYSNEKKLRKHQDKKHIVFKNYSKPLKKVSFSDHVIIHEVKEYHKCRKCPKIFVDYKFLKTHMKQLHKKRKCYICNYCNKKFVDRVFFKIHIKLHCDVCGLLLRNKFDYNEHRRNVCRVLKRHQCRTCNEEYFKFMDLKDHSYEHISTCFVCDICKDQFETKCALSHHIAFLHSNNRPTTLFDIRTIGKEKLYLCNFCDESSMELLTLEKHVQTLPDLSNKAMTGYQDYYFCDQCLKKFDTETDMLQHKWSHYLKTSDNSQERIVVKKETFKYGDPIPEYMQPLLILERVKVPQKSAKPFPLGADQKNAAKPSSLVPQKSSKPFPLDAEQKNAKSSSLDMDKKNTIPSTTGTEEKTVTVPSKKAVKPARLNMEDVVAIIGESGEIKKPIVDPRSKKTIISKHQCLICGKYYSSNYCLNRHTETVHSNTENLQCNVCEETFVWPSLLRSHKCIRLNHPELPFEDARPEIHFENLHEVSQSGFDDLNIEDSEDYMNSIDFEIPAPVVELREYDSFNAQDKFAPFTNLGYKIVVQEVPIEF